MADSFGNLIEILYFFNSPKLKKINIKSLIQVLKSKKEDILYTPRDYQIDIINKSIIYFQENDKLKSINLKPA